MKVRAGAESAKRNNADMEDRGGGSRLGAEQSDSAPLMGARRMRLAKVQDEAVAYSPMPNIEGLNRRIVAMLQEDGRAAFSSIAKELGVSEATVRSRVSRMRDANLSHFITMVNPLALGYTAWAMLGINVAQGVSADEVAQYFRDCPEVVYAMRVAARFDILAEIVCEAPDDLRDFLDTHCYASSRVASVEPMIGLGLYKSLFKWEKPLVAGSGKSKGRASRGKTGKKTTGDA